MAKGILGRKVGMTQVFDPETGVVTPVTVIEAGPCKVLQVRTPEKDGYSAIQLGFDAKEAQELAMYTCEGAANLLITAGNHPEQEIDRVTTPRGCTIEGLNEMEHKGLSSSLIQGMVSSFKKINTIKTEQL